MTARKPHIAFWSTVLATLLLFISISGSSLPRTEVAQTDSKQGNEARLSAKPSLKAILKDAPKFAFSHYFWLPESLGAATLPVQRNVVLRPSWVGVTPDLGAAFPSVRFLTHCLLCSPNAP